MTLRLFDYEELYQQLAEQGAADWAAQLKAAGAAAIQSDRHGKLAEWTAAWDQVVVPESTVFEAAGRCITATGKITDQERWQLERALRTLHPWRKGPYDLCGVQIETEWRSDLKWDRLADRLELRGRRILDVGCGNGYYGWRMLAAGARLVVGLDPFLLYVMQFEVVRKFAAAADPVAAQRHFLLPLSDREIPERLQLFDTVFSMGVLYHRTSPIDHLQSLAGSIRPGGELVLETLVTEDDRATVLVPEHRYAKMRNIWFIPSIPMLLCWLQRTGFGDCRLLDVSRTTPNEQRSTPWMTFESLSDFLDPGDPTRTVEGYPGPVRAIVSATAR